MYMELHTQSEAVDALGNYTVGWKSESRDLYSDSLPQHTNNPDPGHLNDPDFIHLGHL